MADVYLELLSSSKWLQIDRQECLSHEILIDNACKHLNIKSNIVPFKFFYGHNEILPGASTPWPETDTFIRTSISLAGGKGGFGSMLRAIGAQIEKTTNREACRDLSGRRLRDINEEKRLKDWVSKQADREREREERKKKKLEKLKQEFHHEFHDPEYFKVRSEVTDKVHEALEQGIQASTSTEPVTKKRKTSSEGPALKKTALWLGVSDEDCSDSQSSEDESGSASTSSSNQKESAQMKDIPSHSESSNQSINQEQESKVDTEIPDPSEKVVETVNVGEPTPITEQPLDAPASSSSTPIISDETSVPPTTSIVKPVAIPEPTVFLPIDLDEIDSAEDLEALGLNHLKHDLQRRGLKCGGALQERASRLFSVKGLSVDDIDPSLFAKPPKKNK